MTAIHSIKSSEEPRKEKEAPERFSLAAISMLLMDAFNNQVEAAIAEAKNVEANASVQDKLIRSLAGHKPFSIPPEAWEEHMRKTHEKYHKRTRFGRLKTYWRTIFKKELVPAKNGAILHNVTTKNAEENKIRQNLQNALNTIQQKGQLSLAAMNGNIQGSSQTESSEIGILDTFLTITQKIFKKQ